MQLAFSSSISSFSLLDPRLEDDFTDLLMDKLELLLLTESVTHLVEEDKLLLKKLESRLESGSSMESSSATTAFLLALTGRWSGIFSSSLTISSLNSALLDLEKTNYSTVHYASFQLTQA